MAEPRRMTKRWRVGRVKTGERASSKGWASAGRVIEGRPRSVAWGACATPHATAEADPRNLHQSRLELTFGKQATVREIGRDRYGRIVDEVILPDGHLLSRELVRAGMVCG